MFDAGYICKKIYKAVYLVRLMGKSLDPVAYIHIKAGRGAFVEANELYEQFAKIKWNTPLSTADLEISLDESLAENVLKIEFVEDFFDDRLDGQINILFTKKIRLLFFNCRKIEVLEPCFFEY